MIYLNCAATSATRPACVGGAVLAAMEAGGSYGRGAGGEDLGAARTVTRVREQLGELLGFPHPERVCFTSGATASLNTAIMGMPRRYGRAIETDWDHNSSLRPLARLADEQGMQVDFVPSDADGGLDLAALGDLLDEPCDFVVATHASNVTGMVADIAAITALAHARGVPVVVDAAQTAGSLPLPMEELGIDVLCVTGHKALMGPTGTGAVLVRPGIDLAPLVEGGSGVLSAERRQPAVWPEHLEAGTLNVQGIAGLGAAISWLAEMGIDTIRDHERSLLDRFLAGLAGIEGITLYGTFDGDHCGIVSLNVCDEDPNLVADALSAHYGISTRAGLHCAPRMHRALGTAGRGCVRFSWGWFTRGQDVDAAVAALAEIAGA